MQELTLACDLVDIPSFHPFRPDAICVTTNGFVKKNGEAVMGRGVARYAVENINVRLPLILGNMLRKFGNHVFLLSFYHSDSFSFHVVSFPVKPVDGIAVHGYRSNLCGKHFAGEGEVVPGWMLKAKLPIIINSARELVDMTNAYGWKSVFVPRPGCGCGDLDWETCVKPAIYDILGDNRFVFFTK